MTLTLSAVNANDVVDDVQREVGIVDGALQNTGENCNHVECLVEVRIDNRWSLNPPVTTSSTTLDFLTFAARKSNHKIRHRPKWLFLFTKAAVQSQQSTPLEAY